jgi:glycosyltransferase involved in cell wall biosynthesis
VLKKRQILNNSNIKVEEGAMVDVSIIVPLFNEEESVGPMFSAIADALESVPGKAEVIFVDDGSSDNTFAVAEEIASRDSRLRVVKFRRNYGQTPAMAAGIDVARGKTLVTMDGDLQNDPADIPKFLAKMEEGFDIVVGWRFNRQDKLISRKIPSKIANWMIGKVTGVPIKDNGCSLKAYRADVIKHVPLYSEMHRFIPAMASIAGSQIAEIKVNHRARQFGESKYGLSRVYKVLLDLLTIKTITSFAARPLVWFAGIGIVFLIISMLILAAGVVGAIFDASPLLPMVGTAIFFTSLSVFLILGGGLAELVTRTAHTKMTEYPLLTSKEVKNDRDLVRSQSVVQGSQEQE